VRRAREAGFTLIEALVALAVLAVGAVALLGVTEDHAGRLGGVADRTVARWVAEEGLARARLGLPPEERVEMMGRSWDLRAAAAATGDDDLLRLDLEAGPAGGAPLVTLTGYLDAGGEAAP
jgi:general secretion pathway protein I